MHGDTLIRWKWFWAWEDEKEEQWLRAMSQTGWHLAAVPFPGRYKFQAGPACDYVYRLDFINDRKDFDHYLQLFKDTGWEHLLQFGSWQYFRILARPGENPEIFTDNHSKIQKYQRVLFFLAISFPVLIFGMNATSRLSHPAATAWFYVVITAVYVVLVLIYVVCLLMLLGRILELKRKQV